MTEHEQQPPSVQDSILKTTAPLRISASVGDDNWWNPQNASERNYDQLLSL